MTSTKSSSPTLISRRAITRTEGGSEIEHELFCQPRPDSEAIRMESFLAERHNDSGAVVSRPRVTRCMECGAQVVEDEDLGDDGA